MKCTHNQKDFPSFLFTSDINRYIDLNLKERAPVFFKSFGLVKRKIPFLADF